MPLTDVAIRTRAPSDKPVKLSDGGGLYLLLNPNGAKYWRWKYRWLGKEKLLALGVYPDTPLRAARTKRDEARQLLASGIDPSAHRRATRTASLDAVSNSLEVVGREWFARQAPTWAPSHSANILLRLENDVFPWIGKRPISEITAQELLTTLNRVVDRGAIESAHRILQNCGQIFRYGIATGRSEKNVAENLRGALPPVREKHLAAITDLGKVGGLLRAIDAYSGSFVTKSALRLAPLLFVRPGELRQAEWSEIDLDSGEWNIPAEKMKTRLPHLVPLATQSLSILGELYPLTSRSRFVFPSTRSPKRPMSNNAVLSALRRMGFDKDEMSGHGFRAMARTILDETLKIRPDFIEHQLAHNVRDPNGRAYNRTAHLGERKAMMQTWADYLDSLKHEAN